jgi:transcriptional regulator with XRE-family HTH domain
MTEQEIKTLYRDIGLKVRDCRQKKGLNQEVFAQILCYSRASIVNIEKGRQRLSIHLLYEICKAINLKLTDLLPEIPNIDEELNTKWKRKIEDSAEDHIFRDPKLANFLKEIESKDPK